MKNYSEIPALENVYLEDSYVLEVCEGGDSFEFSLLLVLTEKHSSYTEPQSNEQYCYKKASLSFPNVESVEWIERKMQPIKDSDGSTDFGNVDFYTFDGRIHNLGGEWGEVKIVSDEPSLSFNE